MEKNIDVFKLFDSFNLSEKEKVEFAMKIMLNLALDTGKSEYNDLYCEIEKIKNTLPNTNPWGMV